MLVDPNQSRLASHRMANVKRSTSPLHGHSQLYGQTTDQQPQTLMSEWSLPQQSATNLAYPLETGFAQNYSDGYAIPFQSPTELFPPMGSHLNTSPPMERSYIVPTPTDNTMQYSYQNLQNSITQGEMMAFRATNPSSDMGLSQQNMQENSPTCTNMDVWSSGSSDNGWNFNDFPPKALDSSYQETQNATIFNPGPTLQNRTLSESSFSDIDPLQFRQLGGSGYVMVPYPIGSPGTDSVGDIDFNSHQIEDEREPSNPPPIFHSPVKPIDIRRPSSPQRSPVSSGKGSPPGRRQSRKIINPKAAKPLIRRPSQAAPKVETEKRVGRRKGPLLPEQRKQACEIRKVGACLRCKFLKKTVS